MRIVFLATAIITGLLSAMEPKGYSLAPEEYTPPTQYVTRKGNIIKGIDTEYESKSPPYSPAKRKPTIMPKINAVKRYKDIVGLAQELLTELGTKEQYAALRDYLKQHFAPETIQAFKMANHESGTELVKLYRAQKSNYDQSIIDDFEALLKIRKRVAPYES